MQHDTNESKLNASPEPPESASDKREANKDRELFERAKKWIQAYRYGLWDI